MRSLELRCIPLCVQLKKVEWPVWAAASPGASPTPEPVSPPASWPALRELLVFQCGLLVSEQKVNCDTGREAEFCPLCSETVADVLWSGHGTLGGL